MPSTTPISLAARERFRDHQAAAAKAVAAHSDALTRLYMVTSRRAGVVARQDALVGTAAAAVAAAVAETARVMGTEVAAEVLDLSKAEVRRIVRKAR
jgi:hypothetical protein